MKNLTVLKSQKNILIRIDFAFRSFYIPPCGFLTLISLDAMNENYQFGYILLVFSSLVKFKQTKILRLWP
jgi:hypothetical protein